MRCKIDRWQCTLKDWSITQHQSGNYNDKLGYNRTHRKKKSISITLLFYRFLSRETLSMLFLWIESINAAIISDPVLVDMKSSINLKKNPKSQLISVSLLNGTTPGPANHRELLSRTKLLQIFPQFVLAYIGKYRKLSNPCRQPSSCKRTGTGGGSETLRSCHTCSCVIPLAHAVGHMAGSQTVVQKPAAQSKPLQ